MERRKLMEDYHKDVYNYYLHSTADFIETDADTPLRNRPSIKDTHWSVTDVVYFSTFDIYQIKMGAMEYLMLIWAIIFLYFTLVTTKLDPMRREN